MTYQLAVDVSNYTGAFGVERGQCLRARGVECLIAGTEVGPITRTQLAAARDAGLDLEAYIYLYWRADVAALVRQAIETVSGFEVRRLWLDCEDDTTGLAAANVVHRIEAAVAACGSMPCGIYTGRWWWPRATGDSSRFRDLPLWHAEYTRADDILPDFDLFSPYGGWSRPAMWQFRGTTSLCGLSLDLNLREQEEAAGRKDSLDLALLRSWQRFERAMALGRFVFRPAPDPRQVELQRVEGGRGVSFEPPYLVDVE